MEQLQKEILLNYMDLNSDDIETIMDKNVYKIGIPGGLIKIIALLQFLSSDYVLILAWNIKMKLSMT